MYRAWAQGIGSRHLIEIFDLLIYSSDWPASILMKKKQFMCSLAVLTVWFRRQYLKSLWIWAWVISLSHIPRLHSLCPGLWPAALWCKHPFHPDSPASPWFTLAVWLEGGTYLSKINFLKFCRQFHMVIYVSKQNQKSILPDLEN